MAAPLINVVQITVTNRCQLNCGRCGVAGLRNVMPGGFDLVCFKSMLHDWPEAEAKELMGRAAGSLRSGGAILVFERGALALRGTPIPFALVPLLLFYHSFRLPRFYADSLSELGFRNVQVRQIGLEMPFFLVTGSR